MEPKAIRSQKRLMQKWENCSVEEGIMAGVDAYAEAYEDGGREPKAMISSWKGRAVIAREGTLSGSLASKF
jgi:hypothetical protein